MNNLMTFFCVLSLDFSVVCVYRALPTPIQTVKEKKGVCGYDYLRFYYWAFKLI